MPGCLRPNSATSSLESVANSLALHRAAMRPDLMHTNWSATWEESVEPMLRDDDARRLLPSGASQDFRDEPFRTRPVQIRTWASSSTRILGRHAIAAASATRCFCPLDSSVSFSVRRPSTPQRFAASRTLSTVVEGSIPRFSREKAISSATVPMKNWLLGSCMTTPMLSVRCRGELSSTSPAPPTRTAPFRSPGKKVPARPSIKRRTVDLPSPDRPQRIVHVPAGISSFTPRTQLS